jgi:hypothetical protein
MRQILSRRTVLKGLGASLMLLAFLGLTASPLVADEKPNPAGVAFFEAKIRPVLIEQCYSCHSAEAAKNKKLRGGLYLDTREGIRIGGESGAVLIAGKPADNLLLKALRHEGDVRMPPKGKLAVGVVKDFEQWLAMGAPDPREGKTADPDLAKPWKEHWSFKPLASVSVPKVKNQAWVRTPIDAFILARLEKEGATPSSEATRHTLIRRLHLDLTGLPPTPDQVNAFVADAAPDAYERLVDGLLASPHYGERWGRHWLDLARFAESDGYENDKPRPNAYRYRDWVVDAINRDLPYDQFTIEQLAGDLLPSATMVQKVATGMHRNTLHNSAMSADQEEFRTYAIKDRTDTTGLVWMGLTLGCAKCHSHKYDPVSQREYYQLYAFFNNTDHMDLPGEGGGAPVLKSATRPTSVHVRGNFLQKGESVSPGTPAFLRPLPEREAKAQASRLDLARWLVDPAHPLTARVAANRVWQHLFGKGLVPTPDNFGLSGQHPTHPELLDWLATELVRLRWSQKEMIRLMVKSATYRQASRYRPELAARDPDNKFLARQNRYRVEAEIVRDLALSVSGLLSPKIGGPSIVPPFPKELPTSQLTQEELKLPTPERHRRSLYIFGQRTLVHPVLSAFDAADPNQPCIRRERSVSPMQALTLLNDPTFVECAKALGDRLRVARASRDDRLEHGFLLCLGRPPSAAEKAALAELVEQQQRLGAQEEAVWRGVARTLLNLDSFTTRD